MDSVRRNDPCPCGSGKKWKKCYGAPDNSLCPIKLRENREKMIKEHHVREKSVFNFFNDVLRETNIIMLKTKEGNDQISARVQMIIIFSLVDMVASYWYEFDGKTGRTSERPKEWYTNFCANVKNEDFKDCWLDIDPERLYEFRNSLVHFFGLGKSENALAIVLAQNNLPEEERNKWQNFAVKSNKKIAIICPMHFYDLIRKGALLMLDEWRGLINNAQLDRFQEAKYIEGIRRVWEKIQNEGAVRVDRLPEINI